MSVRKVRVTRARLFSVCDVTATGLFAVEGAMVAAAVGLDLFGIVVIAFVSSLVGGIIRDVLLGDVPPASLRRMVYPTLALFAALLVAVGHQFIDSIPRLVMVVPDAAGLALFAVVGVTKALDFRILPVTAVLLGTVSAVGGGVVRDVLLGRVPAILREDVYALAAAAGALTTLLAIRAGMPRGGAMALGFAVCFGLRMAAVLWNWQLPHVV